MDETVDHRINYLINLKGLCLIKPYLQAQIHFLICYERFEEAWSQPQKQISWCRTWESNPSPSVYDAEAKVMRATMTTSDRTAGAYELVGSCVSGGPELRCPVQIDCRWTLNTPLASLSSGVSASA